MREGKHILNDANPTVNLNIRIGYVKLLAMRQEKKNKNTSKAEQILCKHIFPLLKFKHTQIELMSLIIYLIQTIIYIYKTMTNTNPTLNSFMPLAKIGQGTFSSVYKVKRISDGGIYALKKIKIACLKQKEKANALNEIRILASLSSNYIITYKEAFFDEKLHLLCIVMELANEGDLLKQIQQHKQKKKIMHEVEIWKAAYHILSGLNILHGNSILHRDLKSANIFISDGVYKLGDLNVSKVNDHQQRLVQTQTGTPFYASPQIWRDEPYGSQSDIWSFGCILYQMCCLKPPFNGKDLNELYKNVQKGYYEPIPKIYSQQLQQVIGMCLSLRAKDRPSAKQLLKQNGIILSKCDYYEISVKRQQPTNNDKLLSTIKMPTDLRKLNSQLPQSKYQSTQDYQQGKTVAKMSSPNSKISQSDYLQKLIKSNAKSKIQNCKNPQQIDDQYSHQNPKNEPIPLPERIKNHLNGISRVSHERIFSRKNYNQKAKIHSSITEPRQQGIIRNSDYLSPIKQNPNKKKRPLSCNYLQVRQAEKNPPYYISNLRPQSGPSGAIYNSDRKPFMGGLRQKSQMFSDRKILGGQRKDPEMLEKLEKIERDKIRCRSANLKSVKMSGYSELKERLEARYNNIKQSPIYQSQRINNKLNQIKSQQSVNHLNSINYSYAIPNSLSAHIYPHGISKNSSQKYSKNNSSSYLQDVQNRILNSQSKNNRYDFFGIRNSNANESQIRRMIKGQHVYGKILKN